MKKGKLISLRDNWYGLIYTIIIYICGWIYVPTVPGIKFSEGKNNFWNFMFGFYDKFPIVYVILSAIITSILTYIVYCFIKYISKKEFENCYNKKQIQSEYSNFLDNADEVYIFGGTLNFLKESQEQFNKINSSKE